MNSLQAAFATAFPTGAFTLAGVAGIYNSGEPLLVRTVTDGAIGMLFGHGVYPRIKDSFRS